MQQVSLATCAQRGQREFWRDFLALRPIVVSVALRAARVGVTWTRRVAGLARGNSWQQDVAGFRARQSLRVTAYAAESSMRVVVELSMRHPLRSYIGGCHLRQRAALWSRQSVTLLASLAPEKLFRVGRAFGYPLKRCEYANLRRQWLAAQIAARVPLYANLARVSGDVFLESSH